MKKLISSKAYIRNAGPEGLLITVSVTLIALAWQGNQGAHPPIWRIVAAVFASVFCLLCALAINDRIRLGKTFGWLAIIASIIASYTFMASSPFVALAESILYIYLGFTLFEFRDSKLNKKVSDHTIRCKQRAFWGAAVLPLLVLEIYFTPALPGILAKGILLSAIALYLVLFLQWIQAQQGTRRLHLLFLLSGFSIGIVISLLLDFESVFITLVALLILLILPHTHSLPEHKFHWWETFLNHPARLLFSTFLFMCIVGSILLSLPISYHGSGIDAVDAVFTSVSAVCVTGLIVLDTPHKFTFIGQAFILLLIQLGGLGIMTITTVAMQAMGIRMSLRQERALTSMTNTDHKNLLISLATIIKLTLVSEFIGMLLLSALFLLAGDPPAMALWRGLFTAISAFCNAGFALQSNSLIDYQSNSAIMAVVSGLIIMGGLAPATTLILPRWLRKKPIPVSDRIAIITTLTLLLSGTLFILVLEWNGALSELAFIDKLQNAWFQSVTLRTAGFNSIEIRSVLSPVFLIMLGLMFIGGSPGGTAGGIKTTTLGILLIAFWTKISNRHEIIIQHTRVRPGSIYRAVTIVISGVIIWFLVVLMLEITQQIPARDIIFEATSALATVGLSTGATAQLDQIGKVIIIIAMFIGRTGPMTLFTLLSEEKTASESDHPDIRLSLN